MLASLTELKTYRVQGTDGDLGKINDLCFRQNEWIARYVVVEMEDLEREALLLSSYLGRLNRETHTLSADVRREQVTNTDPPDRSQPLGEQEELRLHDEYGWPAYWWQEEYDLGPVGGLWSEEPQAPEDPDEPVLESSRLMFAGDLPEVYTVEAEGGEIGRLLDVIVDDETWSIPYMVVGDPSGAGRMLVATDYVQTIDLGTRSIYLSLPTDAVVNSPVLSSVEPITPELEQSLREYYDRYSR
jgi:sporulation protein YlmC with PRC-barrel domain